MGLLMDFQQDIKQDISKKYKYQYEFSPSYSYDYNIQRDYTINIIYNSPQSNLETQSAKTFEDTEKRIKQTQDYEKEDKQDIKFTGAGLENIVLMVILGLIGYKIVDKVL